MLTVTIFEILFWRDRTAAVILGDADEFERISLEHRDFADRVHMREDYRRLMHHDSHKRVRGRLQQRRWGW